jgi:hypothetical protein
MWPSSVCRGSAARQISIKNEQHQADTEELMQAMIYYRSVFDELLKTETVVVEEK